MKHRRLGWTDLEVSEIILGAWAIGGDWSLGWGPQDDDLSIRTIRRSLELGINCVDTAALYGLGHSEEVVARALQGVEAKPIIATKCGRRLDDKGGVYSDLRPESIRAELEESLRRLRVDTIDLYQIHWADVDDMIEGAWQVIAEAVAAGKVRYGGVSNVTASQLARLHAIHPVAAAQPPYSMFRREIEAELLPWCAAHDVGVIVYSPMRKGLLTGKFTPERREELAADDNRRRDPDFQDPRFAVNLETIEGLKTVARERGTTLGRLAVEWTLRRPEVTAAIVGARTPEQAEDNAAYLDAPFTGSTLSSVDEILAKRDSRLAAL